MKIAQITHTYLPHIGGIEYYINKLINAVNNKYDISILTSDMGGRQNNNICTTLYFKAFPILMRNPFIFGLIRHLLKNKYDIMHLHQIWFLPSFEAAILKGDSKIITTIHGVWPTTSNYPMKIFLYLYKPFAQFILYRSDAIVVLNKREEDKLKRIFHVDSNKIYIIPNGIYPENVDDLKIKNIIHKYKLYDKKVVLFTGRIIPDKNPDVLLVSISKVKIEVDNIMCIIAGPIDHNYRSYLNKMINDCMIKDYCMITGELERDEIIALYKIASVFISIGSWEGVPTRLLEAMHHECASIVYDYGSIEDVIDDGQNGIIIHELNPSILAENIIMLLKDNEFNEKIGLKAKQTVLNEYIWNQTVKKMETLYKNVCPTKDL